MEKYKKYINELLLMIYIKNKQKDFTRRNIKKNSRILFIKAQTRDLIY